MDDRALIIGGGIGGLSAALALRRAGIEAVVFERAPELSEVGTGIGLWINGMAALQAIGVCEAVQARGCSVEVQEFRSSRGQTFFQVQVGALAREYGAPPPMIIRRPDLLTALTEALEDGVCRLGSPFVGCEQDGDAVVARFADGSEQRGSVLIGADGIRSAVRAGLARPCEPKYAGYQYLRALTRFDDPSLPPGRFDFMLGRGDRLGASHAGGGWVYWFAVVVTPEGSVDLDVGRKAEMIERYKDFPAGAKAMIEATPEESILRDDIRDIDPLGRWGEGRITLLGDSAHATTPNLGRGAGEAIEDALVIAARLGSVDSLADGDAVVEALRAYESERAAATAKVQNKARRMGQLMSWRNPLASGVKDMAFRTVVSMGARKGARSDFERETVREKQPVA